MREKARREARRHLLPYTLWTKPDYEINWHHRLIADRLTDLAYGRIRRLILCVGPRRGKSELASRRLPAFAFGLNPDEQIIACSYGQDLATDNSRDVKRIILDDAHRDLFPDVTLNPKHVVADDRQAFKNTADQWEIINHTGRYLARGIGGGITGKGFTLGIIDDPIKDDEEARSEVARERVWRWYQKAFRTRAAPNARILVIMTRWHEDDLVGRLLAEARTRPSAEQWTVVNLREIREDEDCPDDPRSPGEVLWPSHFPLSEAEARAEGDPATHAALYQQRPAPVEGFEFKAEWLEHRYLVLPSEPGRWWISWDLRNGGKTKATSYAVGQVWFRPHSTPGRIYLVDQIRGRWDYNEEEAQFRALCDRYPWATEKLVENKADGRVLIPRLQSVIPGIVPVDPGSASKVERARAVTPLFKAGNVWIPDQSIAPWVVEYIHEMTSFPAAANDDQVDTTTQALSSIATESKTAPVAWWR